MQLGQLIELSERRLLRAPGRPWQGEALHLVLRWTMAESEHALRELLYDIVLPKEGGRRLTWAELHRLDRTVWPLVAVGSGKPDDALFQKLAAAEPDPQPRRAIYGPCAEIIRSWVARRSLRVWQRFQIQEPLPVWHTIIAEYIGQLAIRPPDIMSEDGLPAPDDFLPWENPRSRS